MATTYTYPRFDDEQNPHLPLGAAEYVYLRKDLNQFMNEMLRKLYKDQKVMGKDLEIKTGRLLLFAVGFALSVAGLILFDHPGWIASSGILGVILLVAVLAVPITHLQDQSIQRKVRQKKVTSIKSYYLFHYSLIRSSSNYDEYLETLPESNLKKYQEFLIKYS